MHEVLKDKSPEALLLVKQKKVHIFAVQSQALADTIRFPRFFAVLNVCKKSVRLVIFVYIYCKFKHYWNKKPYNGTEEAQMYRVYKTMGGMAMKAKQALLLKVGASLLTIMLLGACNNEEDQPDNGTNQIEETDENTEQSEDNQ
jgi:hypothetical protein